MNLSSLSYSPFEGGHALGFSEVTAFAMAPHLEAIAGMPVRFVYFGAYDPHARRTFNTGDIPETIRTLQQLFAHFQGIPGLDLDRLMAEIDPQGPFRRLAFDSDESEFNAVFDSWDALERFLAPLLIKEGFEAEAILKGLQAHPRRRIRIGRPGKILAVEPILV
jgi:hypothetical protein